jgi:tripartite ATP-independent transporter DctP family solute receptor
MQGNRKFRWTSAALSLAGLAAFAVLLSADAFAAAKFVGRMSIEVQEGHPKQVAMERFAKLVAERTDGEVEIKVFPNSQLGGELETAEGIRIGSIQFGAVTSSVLANWVPDVQVLDLPFIFRNEDHALKANALLKERLGKKFEAQGFHLLGFSVNGARELISTFPIEKPEDVKGKKMRVIQSPIHIDMWKAVGANPVPIPAPEIYTSLQNKVVDYFDNTTTNYYTFRFYEVAKYFTKLDHIFAMATWIVDAKWFARLPKAHQDAIEKSAAEIQPLIPQLLAKTDDAALAKTVEQGAKVFVVKDKAPWQKLMAPIWDQYSAKIPDSKALIAAIGAL